MDREPTEKQRERERSAERQREIREARAQRKRERSGQRQRDVFLKFGTLNFENIPVKRRLDLSST